MSGSARGRARVAAFKALYAMDIGKQTEQEALQAAFDDSKLSEMGREYAAALVHGVSEKLGSLDETIGPLAKGYSMERLAAVDRTVLRLGAYELLFEQDMPAAVAINEAVEIAKAFSTEESGAFVNGVLAEIARRGIGAGT
jgi:N utilization substance protein B